MRTHNGLEDTLYVYVTSATSAYTVSIVNPRIAVSEKTQIVIRGPGGVETAQRYASGNLRVASVDSTGAVTGIGVGTTTITCLLTNGLSYEVSVEVYAYPSSISAYPQSSTIGVGGTTTIVVTSDVPGTFPYTTTSDNTAVVRVDSSDPSLLHGVSAGHGDHYRHLGQRQEGLLPDNGFRQRRDWHRDRHHVVRQPEPARERLAVFPRDSHHSARRDRGRS